MSDERASTLSDLGVLLTLKLKGLKKVDLYLD